MDYEEQKRLDQKHLLNPEAGDYWNEMFTPICVVLGLAGDSVVLCKTTRAVDADHWTWDLAKVETMTLEAFAGWLRYDSDNMNGKTWCRVSPRKHAWAREAAKEALFGSAT